MNRFGYTRLIFVGIGLSLVFWFLEALLHVLVFGPAELLEQLFRPQIHEVWMRLTVMAMFIAFGVYAQWMLEALRRAEESARLANVELNQIFETAADGMRVVDRNFNLEQHQSFGLIGIRERVRSFGGELHIDTAIDRGTRINVCIPIGTEPQP